MSQLSLFNAKLRPATIERLKALRGDDCTWDSFFNDLLDKVTDTMTTPRIEYGVRLRPSDYVLIENLARLQNMTMGQLIERFVSDGIHQAVVAVLNDALAAREGCNEP